MTLNYSVKTSRRASPLLIEASETGSVAWTHLAKAVREGLAEKGAVLLRGFGVASTTDFREALTGLGMAPWDNYMLREVARTRIDDKVFGANAHEKYHAHGGFHSENCWSPEYPSWISFWCQEAPSSGGETILCNTADAYTELSERLKRKLKDARRELQFVVQHKDYQRCFNTTEPQKIRELCAKHGCTISPSDDGEGDASSIRVSFTRPYIVKIPETGRETFLLNINYWSPMGPPEVWQLFRERHSRLGWTLLHAVYRAVRVAMMPINELACRRLGIRAREVPLDSVELQEIGRAMANHVIAFPWRTGDVLIVDNLQMMHSGVPWTGPRVLRVMLGNHGDQPSLQ